MGFLNETQKSAASWRADRSHWWDLEPRRKGTKQFTIVIHAKNPHASDVDETEQGTERCSSVLAPEF